MIDVINKTYRHHQSILYGFCGKYSQSQVIHRFQDFHLR